jgi:recombination protein RecA
MMALTAEALALVAQVNKKFGPETMITAADMRHVPPFASGNLPLDIILGGGFPANKWTEIIGFESSGKTTVVHKTIANQQAKNPDFSTLWVAAEDYDIDWAQQLGVNTNQVIVAETNAMEEAYEIMLDFAGSRSVDAIVLDSYPALVPDEEAAKSMDELSVSLGARVTNKFFRKAGKASKRSHLVEERPTMGIVINQWREKVGAFSPQGTPKTTPGGLGKNFAYYTRLEVSRAEFLDEPIPGKGKVRAGQAMKFKTIKNKQAGPQKTAETHFYWADSPSRGLTAGNFDVVRDLMTWGVYYDVIRRRGRYFDFGERTWDLKDAIIDSLRAELDLQDDVAAAVLQAAFNPEEAAA